MHDCLGFPLGEFFPVKIQRRSLSSFEPEGVAPCITPDGSKFYTDQNGEMVYAQYSSGAIISIQPTHVTTRTSNGDYWVVSSSGLSFRLD
ncbi:MAG: hypothetical protein K2Y39_00640 [Candidatus Obscuribacterales bacterium]|nr:hypothetical protein [Candidatus Obscuribacterales bacterium]